MIHKAIMLIFTAALFTTQLSACSSNDVRSNNDLTWTDEGVTVVNVSRMYLKTSLFAATMEIKEENSDIWRLIHTYNALNEDSEQADDFFHMVSRTDDQIFFKQIDPPDGQDPDITFIADWKLKLLYPDFIDDPTDQSKEHFRIIRAERSI